MARVQHHLRQARHIPAVVRLLHAHAVRVVGPAGLQEHGRGCVGLGEQVAVVHRRQHVAAVAARHAQHLELLGQVLVHGRARHQLHLVDELVAVVAVGELQVHRQVRVAPLRLRVVVERVRRAVLLARRVLAVAAPPAVRALHALARQQRAEHVEGDRRVPEAVQLHRQHVPAIL